MAAPDISALGRWTHVRKHETCATLRFMYGRDALFAQCGHYGGIGTPNDAHDAWFPQTRAHDNSLVTWG